MAHGPRGLSGAGAQPPATWAKERGRGNAATLARHSVATLAWDTTPTQTTAKICRHATKLRQLYSKSKLSFLVQASPLDNKRLADIFWSLILSFEKFLDFFSCFCTFFSRNIDDFR